MANKKIWLGILVMALVFGMTVVGCDDGSSTTYTVSYSVGTGSGSAPGSQTVTPGTTIYLPGQGSMTAPSGASFTGWKTEGGQDYSIGSSYAVYSNTMFIAQWSGGSNPNTPNTPNTDVPGSSSSNAITISDSGTRGSFPTGLDAVWYKFTKTGSGFFMASDKEYSSVYTADIVVDVYSASLNLMSGPIYRGSTFYTNSTWQDIDVGGSASTGYNLYATNWSGTYYVKVRPYGNLNSNKGTFVLFAP